MAREMGFPRHALNRWRRTREGPGPACVRALPLSRGGTLRERRMNKHPAVVPSSRLGTKPPVRREGGRAGLPARVGGRHVVRGNRQAAPIPEVRPG